MKEVGTLKELNVKPGDVVRATAWGYDNQFTQFEAGKYSAINWTIYEKHPKGFCGMCAVCDSGYTRIDEGMTFRIISRANTPKLWRDMTDAEKGALLLARHEGKEVQGTRLDIPDDWRPTAIGLDNHTYRIRPELKIEIIAEEVELNGKNIVLEYTIVDGIMDKSTIKVQK